jgi:hypothetical protein
MSPIALSFFVRGQDTRLAGEEKHPEISGKLLGYVPGKGKENAKGAKLTPSGWRKPRSPVTKTGV